ncbi:hypothetical protein GCM10009548_71140 [Streptomyces malaysiensis subsp. malaysiensis]|uniref:ATP-grasp domain-containing protein n=1 Tax=Streptomyces malaysiensis TaxID=92644 RepID=A0ABX6WLK6_STRMQ|nr:MULTISPECIES: ATP-grasp domain-containing protein [Streptomyces]QPI61221.1 ATP-grasp domain-containing protein [Streptomyces solisilvae]UHH22981.1 ATP-grasp domain-containing protein [Streptomyces sp. HNM0561]
MKLGVLIVNSRKPVPPWLLRLPEVGDVSVITEPPYAGDFPPEVEVRTVPSIMDVDAVRRAALDVMRVRPVDRVLSPAEHAISTSGYLRSTLGLPGLGHEASLACSNKYVMKREFVRAGLPVTPFRQITDLGGVEEAATETGWPVVVKPVYGGGSLDVFVLEDEARYREFAQMPTSAGLRASAHPLIVEKYVDIADEYHIDGVVHEGKVVFTAPSRYFTPLLGNIDAFTGSYLVPPDDLHHDTLMSLHERAVRAVGLESGVTHLEVFRTEAGFLVGEIACRPAGAGIPDAVLLGTGVDLWRAWSRTALGLDPDVTPKPGAPIVVNCELPIRAGLITELTEADELLALPGVVRVDMLHKVGDTVPERLHSSSATGIVFYEAASETEVWERLRIIRDTFVLRTDRD